MENQQKSSKVSILLFGKRSVQTLSGRHDQTKTDKDKALLAFFYWTTTDKLEFTEEDIFKGRALTHREKIGFIERQPLLKIKIITKLMIQSFLISYYHTPNLIRDNVFFNNKM